MKAYLLAAGYATRMWPLTRNRAKPLLEVGGEPILTHLVRRISPLEGLSEIVVIGNQRFAADFESWRCTLDSRIPIRVLDDGSTNDQNKLGAIGDLAFALERVPVGADDWLVAAGDNLLAFDLRPIHTSFRASGAPTLVVRKVEHGSGPTRYNEVTLGDHDRVVAFREKPPDPRTGLAAIALYFFPSAVASLLSRYLDEGGNTDAPGHFIAWLVERVDVRAARIRGDWYDIGNLESLAAARVHLSLR